MDMLELRDGTFVLTEAVILALTLEERGHTFTARDGVLLVSDGSRLTTEDRAAIQRLKRHLLHIASYATETANG